jgi:antitoxin component YwqK of YwqJK toxin-antitoxin module
MEEPKRISIYEPETIEKVPEIDKKLPTVDNIIFDKDGKAYLPKVEPYTGNYASRYKSNSLEKLGQYIDGVKNGLWTKYYENGNNKFQVKFVSGKKEGVAIYWDENGRKTKEESYRNDLLDGQTVSFTWYQDGEVI